MVEPFDTYPGIEKVESGYTGGHVENPTYEQVKTGTTGHTEQSALRLIPPRFLMNSWLRSTGTRLIQPMPWASFKIVATTTAP